MPVQLDNYVDVATRHRLALERHPDLRVVEGPIEVIVVDGQTHVAVTMTVHRSPDDPLPCRATAWEPFPGKTPYTRGSEMMNASTSALGRALGLMGFGITGSLASREEVRNRQDEPPPTPAKSPTRLRTVPTPTDGPKLISTADRGRLAGLLTELGYLSREAKIAKVQEVVGRPLETSMDLTAAEGKQVIETLSLEAISKQELDRLTNLKAPE